jgi:hypothetical protein
VRYETRIADLNTTIAARTGELAAKSEEVARLAKEGLNTITGGNSFCIFHLGERSSSRGPLASVLHRGDYPLYDLWVTIIDIDRRDAVPQQEMTIESLHGPEIRFSVGTVPVGTNVTLGRLPVPPSCFAYTPAGCHRTATRLFRGNHPQTGGRSYGRSRTGQCELTT